MAKKENPGISEYRKMLVKIGGELSEGEVKTLVHLFKDDITQREKETIKSALDLFEVLEKRDKLAEGRLDILREGLGELRRNDLLKLLPVPPPDSATASSGASGGSRVPLADLPHQNISGLSIKMLSQRSAFQASPQPKGLGVPTNKPDMGPAAAQKGSKESGDRPSLGSSPRALKRSTERQLPESQGNGASPRPKRNELRVAVAQGSSRVQGEEGCLSPEDHRAGRLPPPDKEMEDTLEADAPQETAPGSGHTEMLDPSEMPARGGDDGSEGGWPAKAAWAADDEPSPLHLRDYQQELASIPLATGGNHIICMPTNSGKTVTAAYICRARYDSFQQEANRGQFFKALFIVPTRLLRQQQRDAFSRLFPSWQSVMGVEDQQTFEEALQLGEPEPSVLMLTAQILVNALRAKKVALQDLQMLILDECHHTTLQHPYNTIMKQYLREKQSAVDGTAADVRRSLPQVIGLSASLGVGQGGGGGALDHVLKLCANMDADNVLRVRQNKLELAQYVKVPTLDEILEVDGRDASGRTFSTVLNEIMAQIQERLPWVDQRSLPRRGSQPYETEVTCRKENSDRHEDVLSYMYLAAYNRALMLYEELPIEHCLQTLKQFHDGRGTRYSPADSPASREEEYHQLFCNHQEEMTRMATQEEISENQMLQELVNLLAAQFRENPSSKGIVLTRMRIGTVGLCEFIRASTSLKGLVRPERLVRQGPMEEFCISESAQRDVLSSFRQEAGCNVLVATEIAQEGLDMPACNFVIRYNFVSNEIGTVQSKGRARAEGSKCFLIVERDSVNHKRELHNRRKVKMMEEALDELEAMKEEEQQNVIRKMQNHVLASTAVKEKQRLQKVHQMRKEVVELVCAECKAPLCKVEDLKRKGLGNFVTCDSPDFLSKVREEDLWAPAKRYRDSQTVCNIFCNSERGTQCKNKLGTKEDFFLDEKTVGFSLTAKKFMRRTKSGSVLNLKKWKEIIPEESDPDSD